MYIYLKFFSYLLLILYLTSLYYLVKKPGIEKRMKWVLGIALLACFYFGGGYLRMRILERQQQQLRYEIARFGRPNIGYDAARQVMEYLAPGYNPITGKTYEHFLFPPDLSTPETIPQFPEPYCKFAFMLCGYKSKSGFHFTSPCLSEENLPKKLIEASVIHNPLPESKDPRFIITTRVLKRNDTSFFRSVLTDCELRDSVTSQLVELALRYNDFRDDFYEVNPYVKTVSGPTFHILVTHHGKILYRNNAFDTSKVFLTNANITHTPKDMRIFVYSDNDLNKLLPTEYIDKLWKWEWIFFAGFVLTSILLLRINSITGWWSKKK